MQQQFLLSITIPTWNRANHLNKALSYILPQVVPYSNIIEFIISDNGSTDNTRDVIIKHEEKNPEINLIVYFQENNKGHSGNVKKCRELASGKYLWILSDDDYILDGVIAKVINYLKNNDDIGGIFLNSWSEKKELCFSNKIGIEELFCEYTSNLTLISAIIIYNDKSNDEYIHIKFDTSPWLGLLFLINVYSFHYKMVVLNGKSFIGANEIEREINWFKAFVIDLADAYSFMAEKQFSRIAIRKLRNAILKRHILREYISFKMFNIRRGTFKYWKLSKINKVIFKYYYDSLHFWCLMLPVMLFPKALFSERLYRVFKKCFINIRNRFKTI